MEIGLPVWESEGEAWSEDESGSPSCFREGNECDEALHVIGVRPKSDVIRQARKDGRTVHFASLMDFCHLKTAELAKHLQTHKERVVLQRDNVKDEEGHRAE